jgi:hypothetical protein
MSKIGVHCFGVSVDGFGAGPNQDIDNPLGVGGTNLHGSATLRQYLQAGLIDQLHLAISPIILGTGESLLSGIDLLKLGYKCTEHVTSPAALHVVLTKI